MRRRCEYAVKRPTLMQYDLSCLDLSGAVPDTSQRRGKVVARRGRALRLLDGTRGQLAARVPRACRASAAQELRACSKE